MAARVGKLSTDTTVFFLCDLQDKFRPAIKYFAEICTVANRLCSASKILEIPLVVTEQYPKGLGSTVPEVDIEHGKTFPKTIFTMCTEPVRDHLNSVRPNAKSFVLFGLEVSTTVCILLSFPRLLFNQQLFAVFLKLWVHSL